MKNKNELRLVNIVQHAYKEVAYYNDVAEKNHIDIKSFPVVEMWRALPLLEKKFILQRNDSFISFQHLVSKLQNQLINMHTSGSTGKCLDVFWDKEDADTAMFMLWLIRYRCFKIMPGDRYCMFVTGRVSGRKEVDFEIVKSALTISKSGLSEEKLKKIYNKILEYSPKWMLLQPSIAMLLCNIKKKFSLPNIDSLVYIELTGEMLSNELRLELKKQFGCAIRNQYGCNEAFSIAYECEKGNLHCMEQNVFVEILDNDGNPVEDGNEGNIYITSLNNYAMPFIRYNIGDRGILSESKCKCGNNEKVLKLLAGRSSETITTKSGEKISSYVFVRTFDIINFMTESCIKQYQVIQKEYDLFLIKLVVDDESDVNSLPKLFEENFCEPQLNGAKFEFLFFDSLLPDDNTGKLKWFYGLEEKGVNE